MARQPDLETALARLEQGGRQLRELLAPMEKLHDSSSEVRSRLHALASQYSKADPEALSEPEYVLPAQPAAAAQRRERATRRRSARRE